MITRSRPTCVGGESAGTRLPVDFAPLTVQTVPVHMKPTAQHPLVIFVISPNTHELTLVIDLFGQGGHCAIPIRDTVFAGRCLWRTPPDLILVDRALPVEDRALLRAQVEEHTGANLIPVVEFTLGSIRLGDRKIHVNGHSIGLRDSEDASRGTSDGESGPESTEGEMVERPTNRCPECGI